MGAVFAMTLPGLVILLVVAALVERMARGVGSGRRDHPTASAGFDVLGAAFDPGTRHRLDEEHRVELERDGVEDGAPPRSRIDLSAGTAHLMLPAPLTRSTTDG
ncbi:MAG TPA: DUF6191 domain-containing protein [Candidatus Limnocylindria bacterium]|nr:DUF6191 domain-containing protein [Candidatus Limnocylindria bacterium]